MAKSEDVGLSVRCVGYEETKMLNNQPTAGGVYKGSTINQAVMSRSKDARVNPIIWWPYLDQQMYVIINLLPDHKTMYSFMFQMCQ